MATFRIYQHLPNGGQTLIGCTDLPARPKPDQIVAALTEEKIMPRGQAVKIHQAGPAWEVQIPDTNLTLSVTRKNVRQKSG